MDTAFFQGSRDLFPEKSRWRVSFRDDWAILPTAVEVSDYHGNLYYASVQGLCVTGLGAMGLTHAKHSTIGFCSWFEE